MVREIGDNQKCKSWRRQDKNYMNTPITFPLVPANDASDDPLIIEAEWKARLTLTQTELVGLSGEQLIPIGKVKLEVTFRSEGLFRKTMMKFTVVRASSPYNVILGRTGMRELKAISSTIHAMIKFPTPRGIVTLVARTTPVYECRWSEKKKIEQEEKREEAEPKEQSQRSRENQRKRRCSSILLSQSRRSQSAHNSSKNAACS
ncbi:hypothetical protein Tco_0656733 [Tanacetum coccineum]|uniref:Uncharacterized protein n=1 Tax=Tanacetum coccineum TaxID=301880 RepID=A0ABQ4X9Q1_9ASTR